MIMSSVKRGKLIIGFTNSSDFVTSSTILKCNMRVSKREKDRKERNSHD